MFSDNRNLKDTIGTYNDPDVFQNILDLNDYRNMFSGCRTLNVVFTIPPDIVFDMPPDLDKSFSGNK